MKKLFEPATYIVKDVSEDITKTITETSIENNKALSILNNKHLEIMIDRAIIASYLLAPLSKIINPEHASQFKVVEDTNLNRVNDLLINKTKAVTLNNNSLTFCDTDKKFELNGELLKMLTNENNNVDLANLPY